MTDKLTDTLNLEVNLKVIERCIASTGRQSRTRTATNTSCARSTRTTRTRSSGGGFEHGVTRFGSMTVFIAQKTHTPFWTLFANINDPNLCDIENTVDCAIIMRSRTTSRPSIRTVSCRCCCGGLVWKRLCSFSTTSSAAQVAQNDDS
uniref:Uncharacterized protein n=1 Tax=Anopheles atroparvus TaxID=41427 RepID=A0AAG5CNU6_ANOAO